MSLNLLKVLVKTVVAKLQPIHFFVTRGGNVQLSQPDVTHADFHLVTWQGIQTGCKFYQGGTTAFRATLSSAGQELNHNSWYCETYICDNLCTKKRVFSLYSKSSIIYNKKYCSLVVLYVEYKLLKKINSFLLHTTV